MDNQARGVWIIRQWQGCTLKEQPDLLRLWVCLISCLVTLDCTNALNKLLASKSGEGGGSLASKLGLAHS